MLDENRVNVEIGPGPNPAPELVICATEIGRDFDVDRWSQPGAGGSSDRAARVSKRKTSASDAGQRTEERGSQQKGASSPRHSPPSDGGEGEIKELDADLGAGA